MTEFLFGAYYICRGTKPAAADALAEGALPHLVAAE